MRSRLADQLRDERRRADLARSPEERFELALELGRRALRDYASAHGVTLAEALRVFERNRRIGRNPSRIS
ncbi:MAG: hypothetical protein HMLKMBBP_04004 [Planctomycetes bacterium]|nr:hypothetical protein [Planctomycetota bacterium]